MNGLLITMTPVGGIACGLGLVVAGALITGWLQLLVDDRRDVRAQVLEAEQDEALYLAWDDLDVVATETAAVSSYAGSYDGPFLAVPCQRVTNGEDLLPTLVPEHMCTTCGRGELVDDPDALSGLACNQCGASA